ncbi:TIGR03643 family protein [Lacinutrix chionoecetis]
MTNNIISKPNNPEAFTIEDIDRIIEMAWEDRTPFDAITFQFHIKEQEIIAIMRNKLKHSSFKLWRARVQGRKTKHAKMRNFHEGRFKCSRQKQITHNKISKR